MVAFLLPPASAAQQLVITARAGAMQVTNESFEEIYGATTPTVGLGARADFGSRWSIALSGDLGSRTGELLVFVPEPMPSGIEADVSLQTVNLSFGARFGSFAVLAGPTWLNLREETEFESHSISKYGAHVAVRYERGFGSWLAGVEAGYLQVPEAFGPGGAPETLGDTDFSAVTAGLFAGYRF